MIKRFDKTYADIISLGNLLEAWKEFKREKGGKKDVQDFEMHLMDNILDLHQNLANFSYKHGAYHYFKISDTKPRDIHKATVRDRILHRAIYRHLYPFFDKKFISDSFSCRLWKGTHKAMNRFKELCRKESKNNTKTIWILKCDIRKFFANIDHKILFQILEKNIPDKDILGLAEKVIESFNGTEAGKGLPLGNLTSQLFSNVYMNEFDQFVKHRLKVKSYARYADDFVLISSDKGELEEKVWKIDEFLQENLKLNIHPDKIFIKTYASGMDFLGWMHFPKHRVLRTATKRRMMRNILQTENPAVAISYLGLLSHGNGFKIKKNILEMENVKKALG